MLSYQIGTKTRNQTKRRIESNRNKAYTTAYYTFNAIYQNHQPLQWFIPQSAEKNRMESQDLSQEPQSTQGGHKHGPTSVWNPSHQTAHVLHQVNTACFTSHNRVSTKTNQRFSSTQSEQGQYTVCSFDSPRWRLQAEVSPPESDQDKLDTLIRMEPAAIQNLARENNNKLVDLMEASLRIDPELIPRNIDHRNPDLLAYTAVSWLLKAARESIRAVPDIIPLSAPANLHLQQTAQRGQNAPRTPARSGDSIGLQQLFGYQTEVEPNISAMLPRTIPSRRLPPSTNDPANIWEESYSTLEESGRRAKRQKHEIEQVGFQLAISHCDALQSFPGSPPHPNTPVTPTLNCKYLLGPKVIAPWISSGQTISQYIEGIKWYRAIKNPSLPSHAEYEAVTLARIIDLEMRTHKSPKEAVMYRPSIEVAIRRLYPLVRVKEQAARGVTRSIAWTEVDSLQEVTPGRKIDEEDILEEPTKQPIANRKRMAAVSALHQNQRSSQTHKGQTRSGKGRPQNN